MPKTAVALFQNAALTDSVVTQIESLGIPEREIRTLEEPFTFPVNGIMSFRRLDFELELKQALNQIGVGKSEVEDYIQGLRNGGLLVLASGPDEKVEAAAELMNRLGAVDLETISGREPEVPEADLEDAVLSHDRPLRAVHVRESRSGAQLFVW